MQLSVETRSGEREARSAGVVDQWRMIVLTSLTPTLSVSTLMQEPPTNQLIHDGHRQYLQLERGGQDMSRFRVGPLGPNLTHGN